MFKLGMNAWREEGERRRPGNGSLQPCTLKPGPFFSCFPFYFHLACFFPSTEKHPTSMCPHPQPQLRKHTQRQIRQLGGASFGESLRCSPGSARSLQSESLTTFFPPVYQPHSTTRHRPPTPVRHPGHKGRMQLDNKFAVQMA